MILLLVSIKFGSPHREVRNAAQRLLYLFKNQDESKTWNLEFGLFINSDTDTTYSLAQQHIVTILAREHAELSHLVFAEMLEIFQLLSDDGRFGALNCLVLWAKHLQIIPLSLEERSVFVKQLFVLFDVFQHTNMSELEALISNLSRAHEGQIEVLITVIIDIGFFSQNTSYLNTAKSVCCLICRSNPQEGLKMLVDLEPVNVGTPTVGEMSSGNDCYWDDLAFRWEEVVIKYTKPYFPVLEKYKQFDDKFPNNIFQSPLNRDEIKLILLSQYSYEFQIECQLCLPIILHNVLMRAYNIRSKAENVSMLDYHYEILLNLFPPSHSCVNKDAGFEKGFFEIDHQFQLFLEKRKKKKKLFWVTDEQKYPISGRNELTDKFLPFFVQVFRESRFIVEWNEQALLWALKSLNDHDIFYSLQIYRCLPGQLLTKKLLSKILSLLTKHFCRGKKNLVSEVIKVLRSVVDSTEARKLLPFPQMQWILLAFLKTDDADYFVQSYLVLLAFQEKLQSSELNVVPRSYSLLLPSIFGPEPMVGLQNFFLKGFLFQETKSVVFRMMCTFSKYIFTGDSDIAKIIHFLFLLPWFLTTIFDKQNPSEKAMVESLSRTQPSSSPLSRAHATLTQILSSFASGKYQHKSVAIKTVLNQGCESEASHSAPSSAAVTPTSSSLSFTSHVRGPSVGDKMPLRQTHFSASLPPNSNVNTNVASSTAQQGTIGPESLVNSSGTAKTNPIAIASHPIAAPTISPVSSTPSTPPLKSTNNFNLNSIIEYHENIPLIFLLYLFLLLENGPSEYRRNVLLILKHFLATTIGWDVFVKKLNLWLGLLMHYLTAWHSDGSQAKIVAKIVSRSMSKIKATADLNLMQWISRIPELPALRLSLIALVNKNFFSATTVTDLASTNDEITAKNNIFNFFLTDTSLVTDVDNEDDGGEKGPIANLSVSPSPSRLEGSLPVEKIAEILKQIRNSFKIDLNNFAPADKRDVQSSSPIFSSQHSPVMHPIGNSPTPAPLQELIHDQYHQQRYQRQQLQAKQNHNASPRSAPDVKDAEQPDGNASLAQSPGSRESPRIPLPFKLRHSFSSFPTFVGFDELMDELDNVAEEQT